MADILEGRGYLFREDTLITPVRYRLRCIAGDGQAAGPPEGELWRGSGGRLEIAPGPYMLHTEDGFSVPLEITAGAGSEGLPFRRIPNAERDTALG
jgi:hypothetical protein